MPVGATGIAQLSSMGASRFPKATPTSTAQQGFWTSGACRRSKERALQESTTSFSDQITSFFGHLFYLCPPSRTPISKRGIQTHMTTTLIGRRWALALTIAFVAPQAVSAQNGKLPPLIDRELFFGNPEISGAQISPDGRYISFLKPYKDLRNIWVKRTEDPYSAAKLLTNDTKRPVTSYSWSRDGKYILFVQDQLGDENFNVYAVDPAAPVAGGQDGPAPRNLTAMKGVRAIPYSFPKKDSELMYVGINDRDKAWHDLYKVRISTGEKTLLRQNTERIDSWVFDNAGALRLAART